MAVPFLDLPAATAEIRAELDESWERILQSGGFILGEEVSAFEQEFAHACGAREAVGVGSGLDALHLLLRAHGIGPGDEVIVPAHTFVATWFAVSQSGATPVGVDVREPTANLDPDLVAAAVGPRTRAVIAVHLYGRPADMNALRAVSDAHGLLLLEDAAQAHGARYEGRRAGALGDGAAFSFYPGKNLGALGDGGAVVCDDARLADSVRLLRNYGSRVKYQHDAMGFNSRLDALQAAALRVKLRRLETWNARRRAVAERYLELLAGLSELTLPSPSPGILHAWHLFVVRHPARDELQRVLAERGVETIIHYPIAVHRTSAYAGAAHGALPVTERLAAEVLSLPLGPHLRPEQQDEVVAALRSAC